MSRRSHKPLVAITQGDAAGVGPEVIVGAWNETLIHEWCRPMVVGHPGILRRAVELWQTDVRVKEIESPQDARPSPDEIPCLAVGSDDVLSVRPATIDRRAGNAAYLAVITAARLARDGAVEAIVTAPLHKIALQEAGHLFPGHTEALAGLCGVNDFAMMLYLGPDLGVMGQYGLAVVHVTLHTALKNVFAELTCPSVAAKIRLAATFMQRLKCRNPRIGVCSLNPHGGEGGLFGDEESTIIAPAVAQAAAEGLAVRGPLPTDTLMVAARDGQFDAVVAMYHDQGHIALKLLGMHRAVNITLGLPIIRTSVAHGTAFDIAWQRKAETSSMVEAIRVASSLAVAARE